MRDPIHLDHNATTPVAPEVLDAMVPWLRDQFGNPSSTHPWGRRAAQAVAKARHQVADLIGAQAQEISSPAAPPRRTTWRCSAWRARSAWPGAIS